MCLEIPDILLTNKDPIRQTCMRQAALERANIEYRVYFYSSGLYKGPDNSLSIDVWLTRDGLYRVYFRVGRTTIPVTENNGVLTLNIDDDSDFYSEISYLYSEISYHWPYAIMSIIKKFWSDIITPMEVKL